MHVTSKTKRKKHQPLLLILCLIVITSSSITFASTSSTTLVAYGDYLYHLGIVKGTPTGELHLNKTITRAELAAIITRVHHLYTFTNFDSTSAAPGASSYLDVPSNHWAVPYIEYCKTNELMIGVGSSRFDPFSEVTYQQALMLMANLLKLNTEYSNVITNLDLAYSLSLDGYSRDKVLVREDIFNLVAQLLYVDTDTYVLPLSQVLLLLRTIETDTYNVLQRLTAKLSKDSTVSSLVKYDAVKAKVYSKINNAMQDMSLNTKVILTRQELPAVYTPEKFFSDSRYYLLNSANVTIDFTLDTAGTISLSTQNALTHAKITSQYVDAIIKKHNLKQYTPLAQLVFINNFIAHISEYDTVYEKEFLSKRVDPYKHTAYSLVKDGLGVCQGYADLAKIFMDKLGIPNMLAYNDVNLHVWNKVALGGRWYHLDITWNDNAFFSAEPFDIPVELYPHIYANFLIDDTVFSANHGFIDKPTVGSKVINSVPLDDIKEAYDILPYN